MPARRSRRGGLLCLLCRFVVLSFFIVIWLFGSLKRTSRKVVGLWQVYRTLASMV